MKKFSFLVAMLLFVLAFPLTGHAASQATHIILDGTELQLGQSTQVQNVNGNVMIPIRVVVEQLGFTVDWDSKLSTVTIQQSDKEMNLVINQTTATVNGQGVSLLAAPIITKGTTFVPIRFVSEQMGFSVGWDNSSKTVYLASANSGSGSGSLPSGNSGNSTEETGGPVSNPTGSEGTVGTPVPSTTLTSLTGLSYSDNQLILAVDGQVAPVTQVLTNPNRIVIDLPNVKFGMEFGTGFPLDRNQTGAVPVTDYPDVSQIRYSLFNSNPSTIRIVLDLNLAKKFQMTNLNDGLITIDLNVDVSSPSSTPSVPNTPPPTVPSGSGKKLVVIDAGHGGSDPGAISITKRHEKDFTLATVLKIAALLKTETNLDYVLTRSGDTYPTLSDRTSLANSLKATVFVSIHGNSGSASASGAETLYTRSDSLGFANIMHKYLLQSTGLKDRKVQQESLHVTRETTMPAVLLECGFLSNASDEAKMYSPDYQEKIAEGVIAGIKEFLKLK